MPNPSSIGPANPANLTESHLSFEISSPKNQGQNSPQRKADTISMCHMLVHGRTGRLSHESKKGNRLGGEEEIDGLTVMKAQRTGRDNLLHLGPLGDAG